MKILVSLHKSEFPSNYIRKNTYIDSPSCKIFGCSGGWCSSEKNGNPCTLNEIRALLYVQLLSKTDHSAGSGGGDIANAEIATCVHFTYTPAFFQVVSSSSQEEIILCSYAIILVPLGPPIFYYQITSKRYSVKILFPVHGKNLK